MGQLTISTIAMEAHLATLLRESTVFLSSALPWPGCDSWCGSRGMILWEMSRFLGPRSLGWRNVKHHILYIIYLYKSIFYTIYIYTYTILISLNVCDIDIVQWYVEPNISQVDIDILRWRTQSWWYSSYFVQSPNNEWINRLT